MVRETGEYKGKINWFTDIQLISEGLIKDYNEFIYPTHNQLEDLKDKCVVHLKKQGFVFFDNYIGYRISLRKNGKIKEFGVQFWHIK